MPDVLTIIIDTREQAPLAFSTGVVVAPGTLATGDYSIAGLADLVALERKSLADLVTSFGPERDRFRRELHRMQAYRLRGVVVECNLDDVLQHRYRSNLAPAAVLGTMASWSTRFQTPFWLAGDHEQAALLVESLCRNFVRHLQEVLAHVRSGTTTLVPRQAGRLQVPTAPSMESEHGTEPHPDHLPDAAPAGDRQREAPRRGRAER